MPEAEQRFHILRIIDYSLQFPATPLFLIHPTFKRFQFSQGLNRFMSEERRETASTATDVNQRSQVALSQRQPKSKNAKVPYKEFGRFLRERESVYSCTNISTSFYGLINFTNPGLGGPGTRTAFPTPTQAFILWAVYQENVASVMPLLHRPSVQALIFEVSALPGPIDLDSTALLSAIYLSAVISMTNGQCLRELGERRADLLVHFRRSTEMAFAKGNLLGTESFTLLQAAVLYLSCIRKHDEESGVVWAMATAIIRLARNIRLHWDGTNDGSHPFETEMRRRLWWHICILDVRVSEDQGTESEILDMDFDTCLPLNVNDDDISPTSNQPVQERAGLTDTTFCIMRCEAILAIRLMRMSLNTSHSPAKPNLQSKSKCDEHLSRLEHRLWTGYVSHCDLSSPLGQFYIAFARIVPRMYFVIHHPMSLHDISKLPLDMSDWFFLTAIEALEFNLFAESFAWTTQWMWVFRQSSTRWYFLTILLAEICVRPPCPSVDRAWLAASSAYKEWGLAKAGGEWRAVSALMDRVLAVRGANS